MGGSRCPRIRQTWTSSLSTNASSIHQKWNTSPRAQLNTSREPQKSKRTRKIPAELGRAKERREKKNRKGNGMGPATLGGSEERRGLHLWGRPSLGEPSWDGRGSSSSVGGEHGSSQRQQDRGDLHTGTAPSPAHPA